MCRSIKPLRKYDQVATDEEVRAAALQFVRKVSGFHRPTAKHVDRFDQAVGEVAGATRRLLDELAANVTARRPG
jgi:hypothetical protein